MKYSLAKTASSPFVTLNQPPIHERGLFVETVMMRAEGSLNEPDGGDKNGGGKDAGRAWQTARRRFRIGKEALEAPTDRNLSS